MIEEQYILAAQRVGKEYGIPPSIILAQMRLESGASFSTLATEGKNLFGVKGIGTAGSIYLPTKEFKNGGFVTEYAQFAKYNSYDDSFKAHAELLSKDRYQSQVVGATSVSDWAYGIWRGGYATDPEYPEKLLGVIESLNLQQYDSGDYATTGGIFSASSNTLFVGIVRFSLIFMVMVIAVIFFLQAFPEVKQAAMKVTKKTPQGKALAKVVGK